MKPLNATLLLTALNLFVFGCALTRTASAPPAELRVKSLELVDDQGRVRAELKVFPADPHVKMPDGSVGYPETVLLRLVNSKGAPNVKIAATEDGSGVSLGGDS